MILRYIGKYTGIAFQIIDDTLDYFSVSGKSGKDTGNDLKEGKMSLPLIICFQRCSIEEKRLMEIIIRKKRYLSSLFITFFQGCLHPKYSYLFSKYWL